MSLRKRKRRDKSLVPKELGFRLVPKDESPTRDDHHMDRVREQPCLVCGLEGVAAHHIRECYPRTTGVRVGDDKTVPLCPGCHDGLHRINNDTYWTERRIDPVKVARFLYENTLRSRGEFP